jgi:hypothetical protein
LLALGECGTPKPDGVLIGLADAKQRALLAILAGRNLRWPR